MYDINGNSLDLIIKHPNKLMSCVLFNVLKEFDPVYQTPFVNLISCCEEEDNVGDVAEDIARVLSYDQTWLIKRWKKETVDGISLR